jgi:hypothetical protein
MAERPTLEEKIRSAAQEEHPVFKTVMALFEESYAQKEDGYFAKAELIRIYQNHEGKARAVITGKDHHQEIDLPVSAFTLRTRLVIMSGLDIKKYSEPQTGSSEFAVYRGYSPDTETETRLEGKFTLQTYSLNPPGEKGLFAQITFNHLNQCERKVPKSERERIRACGKKIFDTIIESMKEVDAGHTPLDIFCETELDYTKILSSEDAALMRLYETRPFLIKRVIKA